MIDAATGAITLGDTTIDPTTTLDALRRSSMGAALEKGPASASPWQTWSAGVCAAGGRSVAVSLTFGDERLAIVRLSLRDDRESASWEDWSEQRERRRKTKHDAWLKKMLGAPTRKDEVGVHYDYAWGAVLSTFDPRSGSSEVVVSYR